MDFLSTLKGSLLEGFFPAGWDFEKILGALAGTGSAENYNILHLSVLFYFVFFVIPSFLVPSFRNKRVQVLQATSLLVVVQAIAQNKVVGNLEGHIVELDVLLQLLGLEEQGADVNRGGIASAQRVNHLTDGKSALDDILQDNDRTTAQVFVDAHHLLDLAC